MLSPRKYDTTAAVLARMRNMRALWLHSDMNAKLEGEPQRKRWQKGYGKMDLQIAAAAHCHDGSPKEHRPSEASNAIMQGTCSPLSAREAMFRVEVRNGKRANGKTGLSARSKRWG